VLRRLLPVLVVVSLRAGKRMGQPEAWKMVRQTGFGRARWMSSSSPAGSRLLTARIPNRPADASQSCHSAGPVAASHGWISMSASFIGGRAGGYQAAGGPDVGPEPG
jgi:hypothetical protein